MGEHLPECMCTTGVPGICGGWRRALDPLEMELQTVLSQHVGTGSGSSLRGPLVLDCWSTL